MSDRAIVAFYVAAGIVLAVTSVLVPWPLLAQTLQQFSGAALAFGGLWAFWSWRDRRK